MQQLDRSSTAWSGRLGWLAALLATSLIFSLGLACAVPLAGLAALAAWRQSRRDALLCIAAVWLVNQCVGFAALGYPLDLPTLGWGVALGAAALAATWAASGLSRRTRGLGGATLVFVAAFAVYEGLLWSVTQAVGATTVAYQPLIVARILALNGATFAGLLAASAFQARADRHAVPEVARPPQPHA